MADGDQYIYTGRLKSMEEVDRELYKLLTWDKLGIFYNTKMVPLFKGKKKSLESISQ